MNTKYIEKALERAHYAALDDGAFCATVCGLRGVIALGRSVEACRRELAETVVQWVFVRVACGLAVPPLGGVTVGVRRLG